MENGTDLYRKYRPQKWSQMVGQDRAVKALRSMLEPGLPHALMLVGD